MAEEDTEIDDAAAADEWAAMLEEEDAAEEEIAADSAEGDALASADGEEDTRVLNQDEIDLLLGFDSADDGEVESTGIHAILDKSLMAYEKLPMMEVVWDRLVRMLSSSMRNFTSDNIDISIDSMTSLRFDDYLNSIPLPALLTVFRAVEWENFGLITIDSSLIYSTVEVLLGGRRSHKTIRVEGRPYTTIEQDLVQRMVEVLLADMSSAFDPLSPVTFQYERLENNPRFATIARPANPALLVRLRVDMEERGGVIEILLPHTTLEPIRDLLLQMFIGEKFGQDTVWEKHLGREIRTADVHIDAILSKKDMKLGDLMDMKVGTTVMLEAEQGDDILLQCDGVKIGDGKLGCVGDNMAISLNDGIKKQAKDVI
jgi:flagellar motor switch protein FliM